MTENPVTCRKCGSPVTARMKFCESCGAKIGSIPTCPRCSAELPPGVKFCENCGMRVATAAAPVEVVRVQSPTDSTSPITPVPEPVPADSTAPVTPAPEPAPADSTAPVTPVSEPVPADSTAPVTPAPEPAPAAEARLPGESPVDNAAKTGDGPAPASGEKTASVMVKEAGNGEEIRRENAPKKPVPKTTVILAGIIILVLLGAAVYFFILSPVTGPVIPALPNQQMPILTTIPYSPSASQVTPAATPRDAPVSLTPGPTQVPPSERVIVIDTERDPITSTITVTFRGGDGQFGVSQIVVSLTRSDGTTETKTFRPDRVGSGVTLQGTTRTDRLEVTSYFFTGERYKIIDQIFEYKKRSG